MNTKGDTVQTNVTQMSPGDVDRLWKKIMRDSGTKAQQYRQWASSFATTAQELSRGWAACPERASVFWIRLHGVIVEMKRHYEPRPWQWMSAEGSLWWPRAAEILRRHRAVYDMILRIQGVFSEDELIFIDYRRQTECHILQNGYDLRVQSRKGGGAKVLDAYRVSTLDGKEYDIDDLDLRIRRLIRPFISRSKNGELEMATLMAATVSPLAAALVDAMAAMNKAI